MYFCKNTVSDTKHIVECINRKYLPDVLESRSAVVPCLSVLIEIRTEMLSREKKSKTYKTDARACYCYSHRLCCVPHDCVNVRCIRSKQLCLYAIVCTVYTVQNLFLFQCLLNNLNHTWVKFVKKLNF